jgi:hypothetical protein
VRSELHVARSGTEYWLMEKLLLYHFSWKFPLQNQTQCETLVLDAQKVKCYIWSKALCIAENWTPRKVNKKLCNTNQGTVQFYKLIFNYCCLLHVLKFVGSFSG